MPTRIVLLALLLGATPALAQDEVLSPLSSVPGADAAAQARAAADRGDPAEALSRYLRIVADHPDDASALAGAGRAALAVGDVNAAAGFLARAEARDPRNGEVKVGLADTFLQRGDYRGALRYFRDAVGLGVPVASIAADRGLAYDLRGDQRRAQADYALALAARPDVETTRRLALSQAIAGDRATALVTLDPLLRRQDVPAWRARAFVYALTGDAADALSDAALVMPRDQVDALAPYLPRLATLRPGEKAAAIHLGRFPGENAPPSRSAAAPPSRAATSTTAAPVATASAAAVPPTVAVATPGQSAPVRIAQASPPVTPTLPLRAIAPSSPPTPAAIASAAAAPSTIAPTHAQPVPTRMAQASPSAIPSLPARAATVTGPTTPADPFALSSAPVTATPKPVADLPIRTSVAPDVAPIAPDPAAAQAREQALPAMLADAGVQAEARASAAAAPTAAPTLATPPAVATPAPVVTTAPAATAAPATPPSAADRAAEEKARRAEAAARKKAAEEAKAKAAAAKAEAEERQAKRANPARHWVQVAGGANKNDLDRAWDGLKAKWPKQLAGRSPWTLHYRFTNRLLIGPFASSDAAQDWVSDRKKEGFPAFRVETNAGDKVERVKD